MQNHPDLAEVLTAVGRFLEREVRPALKEKDSGLAFRALIASHLCQLSSAELGFEEAQDRAELEGLSLLYPSAEEARSAQDAPRSRRKAVLGALNQRLAEEIRGGLSDPQRSEQLARHLQQTLRTRLMTINPRFDSAADVP
jgi:hypothetical protein